MTSRDFCYWLQGYFEMAGVRPDVGCTLTNEQVKTVQRHLSLVFVRELDKEAPPAEQEKLNKIHHGTAWPQLADARPRC